MLGEMALSIHCYDNNNDYQISWMVQMTLRRLLRKKKLKLMNF